MPYGLNKKRPAKKFKWKNMVYKKMIAVAAKPDQGGRAHGEN